MYVFYGFLRFFKIQKNMTFYVFFELLHTFSRTVVLTVSFTFKHSVNHSHFISGINCSKTITHSIIQLWATSRKSQKVKCIAT